MLVLAALVGCAGAALMTGAGAAAGLCAAISALTSASALVDALVFLIPVFGVVASAFGDLGAFLVMGDLRRQHSTACTRQACFLGELGAAGTYPLSAGWTQTPKQACVCFSDAALEMHWRRWLTSRLVG